MVRGGRGDQGYERIADLMSLFPTAVPGGKDRDP